MPISFGRKSKTAVKEALATRSGPLHADHLLITQGRSRLIDLRNPEIFRAGFIPGSYNVPEMACVTAAQRTNLFRRQNIYLLADDVDQLCLCSGSGDLGEGAEMAGWFGPDAIQEWQKLNAEIGSIEAINAEMLSIRMAAWDTLVFDIYQDGEECPLSHPASMRFRMEDLPLSMEGLPAESSICLTARTNGLASFAASLLWNFGFHRVSYLRSGCRVPSSLSD